MNASNGVNGQGAHDIILRARGVTVSFGTHQVLNGLDLDVRRGEILGFVGGSGSGKSVLMRAILGLIPMQSGTIELFGERYSGATADRKLALDKRMGVLFQHGALFSALTVAENIQVPMREYLKLPQALMDELAAIKIDLVGLPPESASQFPSELSGGMIKRAGLARALSLDPDIVFLDEPTSGLDPVGAADFDDLIASLRDTLGLTVYMVTHDIDSLNSVCDRVAVLREGQILINSTLPEVSAFDDAWIRSYFQGKRFRAMQATDATGRTVAFSGSAG